MPVFFKPTAYQKVKTYFTKLLERNSVQNNSIFLFAILLSVLSPVFFLFFAFALQTINFFSKCKLLTFNLNAGRSEATVLKQYKRYTRRSLH